MSARWRCSTSWRRTTSPWSARPAPIACGSASPSSAWSSTCAIRTTASCASYYAAIKKLGPSQIEAIDMGRRGLHNEGSELLRERLAGKIEVDLDTARRLFTLICALHITS